MAAQRPALPRLARAVGVSAAELGRLLSTFTDDVRRFLAAFVAEYDTHVASRACPLEAGGLVVASDLPTIAGAVTTTGVAYWVYLGRTTRDIVAHFVEFTVSVIGAGAQVAEVALCSSPSAPSRAGLTLTKLAAADGVDTLVTTGVKRNTTDFNASIPVGTHLWAGLRTAMAVTQPTLPGLTLDMAQGRAQSTAAAGSLTGPGPFYGSIIAAAITWQAPDLRLVCS